jgi:AraC family transcriptional regulator of adaptative response/methylated-DNA-[protein]-cysteine methyltransferase
MSTSLPSDPPSPEPLLRQYKTVKKSIEYLRAHFREQPSLSELAKAVHMSEFHLQRVFTEWAGISPKKFLQFLTKEYALSALHSRTTIEQSALDLGLSSPSRLHDLIVTCVAMTPGEVKAGGQGVQIKFGTSPTPFGQALIAWTNKGICHLMFSDSRSNALAELKFNWPRAEFEENTPDAESLLNRIFFSGEDQAHKPLKLLLKGTPFQMKVWEALLKIMPSELTTYSAVADLVNAPNAQRAVGTAIGKNSIAYLIPCHRVIRASGEISNYRWGIERKMAMIGHEASRVEWVRSPTPRLS